MKKIIAIIIAACMFAPGMMISVFASDEFLYAYNEIELISNYYELSDNQISINNAVKPHSIGFGKDGWASVKLDFGTVGARVMSFYYGIPDNYAGGTLSIYLDDLSSEPIISYITESTGGFNTFEERQFVLDFPITGEHILYFKGSKSGTCNITKFSFKSEYKKIVPPKFTLYDENSEQTENYASAKALSADASVLNFAPDSIDANLIMVPYSPSFERLRAIAVESKANINGKEDTAELKVTASLADSDAETVFFAALLDNEFKPISASAFLNAPEALIPEHSIEKTLECYISEKAVTLYGMLSDSSESVLIGLRDSSVGLEDYEAYEFIYETDVYGGKYEHTFLMQDDTPTGSYTAVITSSGGSSETLDFHYTRPGDIIDAFKDINASNAPAADGETAENTIDEMMNLWKDTLGLDLDYINSSDDRAWMYTQLYGYLPFADLNELNDAISKTMFLNKINTGSDIIETLEEYKAVIGLQEDYYYSKYFANIGKTVLADKMNEIIKSERPLASTERFCEIFREAVTLTMFSNQIAWGVIDELIADFGSILNSSYVNKYQELSDNRRKSVANEFLNTDFSVFGELVKLLETEYEKVQNNSSDSNSSSGGESRGGGSYKVEVPVIEPPSSELPEIRSDEEKGDITFSDLADYTWAEEAVLYLAKAGIISGKAENLFYPGDSVTRKEFVKILVLGFGGIDENAECSFSDISESAWYYPYVATAYGKGWVNGYDDGNFGKDDNITREQMAVMLYRTVLDVDGATEVINSSVSFVDYGNVSPYASEAVMGLAKAGVMNGVGMGLFGPERRASRAEAAVLVYKYLIRR